MGPWGLWPQRVGVPIYVNRGTLRKSGRHSARFLYLAHSFHVDTSVLRWRTSRAGVRQSQLVGAGVPDGQMGPTSDKSESRPKQRTSEAQQRTASAASRWCLLRPRPTSLLDLFFSLVRGRRSSRQPPLPLAAAPSARARRAHISHRSEECARRSHRGEECGAYIAARSAYGAHISHRGEERGERVGLVRLVVLLEQLGARLERGRDRRVGRAEQLAPTVCLRRTYGDGGG